ncbi:MAG TPA: response regulator [Candidatus Binataceae bacterium]|nr:response regulator [Candidatus Binataceae bacterium]
MDRDRDLISKSAAILIVEDDEDARSALAEVLEMSGYAAVGVSNGLEALGYLKDSQQLPSLIILDLMMHGMDGWEFRRLQKRDSKLAHIPVIVVTALNGARIDANEIMVKPLDIESFLGVVKQYAGGQRG